MPTEISVSAGLTFRITNNGVEKFDINRRQPKIVQVMTSTKNVSDAECSYWSFLQNSTVWPAYNQYYLHAISCFTYDALDTLPTPIDPADGFLLHSINFPSSLNSGELQVDSSLGNSAVANGSSAHMFHGIYDKWVNINGGAILRIIFSPAHEGWCGSQIFACRWKANANYPASSSWPFVVQTWVATGISGLVGNRTTNTSSNVNQDYYSPPSLYAMNNGLTGNGWGKVRMTHMDCYVKTFICV